MKYFKKLNFVNNEPIYLAKVNLDVSMIVSDYEISIQKKPTGTYGSVHYFEKNGYEKATRQEFDDFYKKVVSEINKISSL